MTNHVGRKAERREGGEGADIGPLLGGRIVPRIVVGLLLAVAVVTGLALFGDARELAAVLRDFPLWLIPPVLGLTLFNYALRFVKWQLYLRQLGIPGLPVHRSALIYLSGFSMSVTPGKVGEVIKCLLLRRFTGAPVSRTTAILAAERVTDGIAMLILASIGATQFAYGRPLLGVTAVLAVVAVFVLQRPHLVQPILAQVGRRQFGSNLVGHATNFFSASDALLQPRLLVTAVALGTISWAGECVAFYLVLIGLDIPPSFNLLLIATFVLAVSSIAGALSMLPGGLGVAEASVAGMLILLVTDDAMTRGVAAAATLIIRFATLWFAVILGAIALSLLQRQWRRGAPSADQSAEMVTSREGGIQRDAPVDSA